MVDPRRVTRHYLRRSRWEKLRFGLVALMPPSLSQGGAWDRRTIPCEDHPTHRLLTELYAADLVMEHTSLYGRLMEAARTGRPVQRRGEVLSDEAAIRRFLAGYVRLFESMRAAGYRAGASKDEPGVAIGRDGEVIKVANGNHRFAIARLFGLAPIPVDVHYVHRRWYAATPPGPDRLLRSIRRARGITDVPAGEGERSGGDDDSGSRAHGTAGESHGSD